MTSWRMCRNTAKRSCTQVKWSPWGCCLPSKVWATEPSTDGSSAIGSICFLTFLIERLFRLFKTHWRWTDFFLANPTTLGVVDSYGIELLHPAREGRSRKQIARKGKSNYRWIVGGKIALVVNQLGLVVGWACATANVHDTAFQPLIAQFQDEMVILADHGFHAKQGDPPNLKICPRGRWNVRMVIETVLSMLTTVCHFKKVAHRVWEYFRARLGFMMAAFNILAQWNGLHPDKDGFVRLSIAEFSL